MDAAELTRQQLDALTMRLGPMLGYLQGMQARMQQRKFPADDPLAKSTAEAIEKVQSLLTVIHALSLKRAAPGNFNIGIITY